VEQLEAEHSQLVQQWADLPTARAKAKARERFAALEARIDELRRQQHDASEDVARHCRELTDLQEAIYEARLAMKSEAGAQALRRRAEALRGTLCRIECEFVATGKKSFGPGNTRSKLVALNFIPVAGEVVRREVNVEERFYASAWKNQSHGGGKAARSRPQRNCSQASSTLARRTRRKPARRSR
jgi:hypothetical protein